MTTTAARECATDFTRGACDGVEICKPGAVAAGKAPRPSPSPSRDSPSPAPAPADEDPFDYEKYPPHAAFFGYIGATAALVFANLGAAYGTAKSGRGISTMGVLYPNLVRATARPCAVCGRTIWRARRAGVARRGHGARVCPRLLSSAAWAPTPRRTYPARCGRVRRSLRCALACARPARRAGHEAHHPRRHGWCARHLWAHHRRHYRQRRADD